jgi:ArsR family transcriptional regulator
MDNEAVQKALKALADPTRFRIVEFLSEMCCGEASVDEQGGVYARPTASEVCCHLTGVEKITSTISHHLHELENAGLISIERQGKRMLCTLRPETIEQLTARLKGIANQTSGLGCK